MQNPNPDPGEEYQHVNTALFSIVNPITNQFLAWFCSVPTQTLPNRSFFHASSSSGFVVNQGQGGYGKWPRSNNAPTIFNRLSDAGKTWRVYYDATQIVPMTALIHGSMLDQYWDKNFYTMDEFYQDVANGTLPAYAFVEPRSLYNNNDYHPPAPLAPNVPIGGWSDVRAGDLLVHDIYTAVKASATMTGSNALNALPLVTFDEHGNCFDHVAPPTATTPQNPRPEGELNFFFDRLGVRVPTIVISAYTEAGSVINRPIHHGAVVRTLCTKYNLAPLTDRDHFAPDLSDAITLDEPRFPSTWPTPIPRIVPPPPPGLEQRPLNVSRRRSWASRSPGSVRSLARLRFPHPGGGANAVAHPRRDRFKHA